MSENKQQFTLLPLDQKEGEVVIAKLKEFLDGLSIDLVAGPVINQNGTLGAEVKVFKKVELVAKEAGIPFPKEMLENGPEEGSKA